MTSTYLITTCALLFLVIFAQVPSQDLWASELTNFAHGPAFAVLTVLLFKMVRTRSTLKLPPLAEYAIVVVVALALGAIVELLQGMIGRDRSVEDLVRDAQGTLTAVGFLVMVDPKLQGPGSHRLARPVGLLVGLAGTAMIAWPLVASGAAHLDRNRNLPTLVDFDRPTSMHFVHALGGVRIRRTRIPPAFAGHGKQTHALMVETAGRPWWGLMLREPVSDWRNFKSLAVTIANPARETLTLELRLHDRDIVDEAYVPFTTRLEVPAGSLTTSRVPLTYVSSDTVNDRVDLAHVHSLMLARKGANRHATEFYLLQLRLE